MIVVTIWAAHDYAGCRCLCGLHVTMWVACDYLIIWAAYDNFGKITCGGDPSPSTSRKFNIFWKIINKHQKPLNISKIIQNSSKNLLWTGCRHLCAEAQARGVRGGGRPPVRRKRRHDGVAQGPSATIAPMEVWLIRSGIPPLSDQYPSVCWQERGIYLWYISDLSLLYPETVSKIHLAII